MTEWENTSFASASKQIDHDWSSMGIGAEDSGLSSPFAKMIAAAHLERAKRHEPSLAFSGRYPQRLQAVLLDSLPAFPTVILQIIGAYAVPPALDQLTTAVMVSAETWHESLQALATAELRADREAFALTPHEEVRKLLNVSRVFLAEQERRLEFLQRISLCFTANPLSNGAGEKEVSPLLRTLHVNQQILGELLGWPLHDHHRPINALRLAVPAVPGEEAKRPATSLLALLTGRVSLDQSSSSLLGNESGCFALHLILPTEVVMDAHQEYAVQPSSAAAGTAAGAASAADKQLPGTLTLGSNTLITIWESAVGNWTSLFIKNEFAHVPEDVKSQLYMQSVPRRETSAPRLATNLALGMLMSRLCLRVREPEGWWVGVLLQMLVCSIDPTTTIEPAPLIAEAKAPALQLDDKAAQAARMREESRQRRELRPEQIAAAAAAPPASEGSRAAVLSMDTSALKFDFGGSVAGAAAAVAFAKPAGHSTPEAKRSVEAAADLLSSSRKDDWRREAHSDAPAFSFNFHAPPASAVKSAAKEAGIDFSGGGGAGSGTSGLSFDFSSFAKQSSVAEAARDQGDAPAASASSTGSTGSGGSGGGGFSFDFISFSFGAGAGAAAAAGAGAGSGAAAGAAAEKPKVVLEGGIVVPELPSADKIYGSINMEFNEDLATISRVEQGPRAGRLF